MQRCPRRAGSRPAAEPASAPDARAGRGGFPLAVGPGLGQALWVEVYVGRDRPAGVYEGTLAVMGYETPRPMEHFYSPRILGVPRVLLNQVVEGVGGYFKACLKAGERLPAPSGLLMTLDRTRRALNGQGLQDEDDTRLHLLHALAGLRLSLLPGVEFIGGTEMQAPLPDGAPL